MQPASPLATGCQWHGEDGFAVPVHASAAKEVCVSADLGAVDVARPC